MKIFPSKCSSLKGATQVAADAPRSFLPSTMSPGTGHPEGILETMVITRGIGDIHIETDQGQGQRSKP